MKREDGLKFQILYVPYQGQHEMYPFIQQRTSPNTMLIAKLLLFRANQVQSKKCSKILTAEDSFGSDQEGYCRYDYGIITANEIFCSR